MPHQNIFRCHIKRPGPRAGTKTAVPVGRARTPASPPFATNRTVTIPAILSSRTRAKAPCVHLRSITPCQASRIATAELRRQASLTLAFRPALSVLRPARTEGRTSRDLPPATIRPPRTDYRPAGQARRKPSSLPLYQDSGRCRLDTRQSAAEIHQPPPRRSRDTPYVIPLGSPWHSFRPSFCP